MCFSFVVTSTNEIFLASCFWVITKVSTTSVCFHVLKGFVLEGGVLLMHTMPGRGSAPVLLLFIFLLRGGCN